MFLRFDELFGKQLQKLPHFVRKHENSSIWPKLLNFFEQTTMFWCFDELFSKWFQKVAQFVKKHEKSSIWPKLCHFSKKYHVFGFRSTFQEKVAKSALFRKKARKIIDLAKSFQNGKHGSFLEKLLVFSKKWLISRKGTKNHPFGQNLQLFEETTMFRRFGHLFSKKLQKVAYFEKMHEKSSILPKLATFRENYHVSAFW